MPLWTLPLALLAAVSQAPSDRLCVRVQPRAPVATPDLVAAIQARIVEGALSTESCPADADARFTVTVRPHSPVSVLVLIGGRGLEVRTVVTVDGLAPEEVAQYVAVTAVEAIRPLIDAPREPPTVPEVERCPEPRPCPEPIVRIERVEPGVHIGPHLAVGVRLGVAPVNVDGALELGFEARTNRLGFGLFSNVAWAPPTDSAQTTLSLWQIGFGTEASVYLDPLRLGAFAQMRLSVVGTSGGAPVVEDGIELFVNGGLGAVFDYAIWSTPTWRLGLLAKVAWWPKPDRFLVQGEPLLSGSHLVFFVGPRFGWMTPEETSSKAVAPDQGH